MKEVVTVSNRNMIIICYSCLTFENYQAKFAKGMARRLYQFMHGRVDANKNSKCVYTGRIDRAAQAQ
jgi:hypothetical protein